MLQLLQASLQGATVGLVAAALFICIHGCESPRRALIVSALQGAVSVYILWTLIVLFKT